MYALAALLPFFDCHRLQAPCGTPGNHTAYQQPCLTRGEVAGLLVCIVDTATLFSDGTFAGTHAYNHTCDIDALPYYTRIACRRGCQRQ